MFGNICFGVWLFSMYNLDVFTKKILVPKNILVIIIAIQTLLMDILNLTAHTASDAHKFHNLQLCKQCVSGRNSIGFCTPHVVSNQSLYF